MLGWLKLNFNQCFSKIIAIMPERVVPGLIMNRQAAQLLGQYMPVDRIRSESDQGPVVTIGAARMLGRRWRNSGD